jgi:hypothetical protein
MAGNARFHDKAHRKNHHTSPTVGFTDSASDPIASSQEPFQGDFVLNGRLSANSGIEFLSANVIQDVYCQNLHIRDTAYVNFLSSTYNETIISDGQVVGNGDNTLTLDFTKAIYTNSPLVVMSANDVKMSGNLTIQGNITILGDASEIDTTVVATSSFSVTNHTTNPALSIVQFNYKDIAVFQNSGSTIVTINSAGILINGYLSSNGNVIGNNITALQKTSSNWDSTFNTVTSNSAFWQNSYVALTSNSANWNSTYSVVSSNSAFWVNSYVTLTSNSANWNSTYTNVSSNSAFWQTSYTILSSNSSNWNSTYSTVLASSSVWLSGSSTNDFYSNNLTTNNLIIQNGLFLSVSTLSTSTDIQLLSTHQSYWFIGTNGATSINLNLPYANTNIDGLFYSIKNTYNGGNSFTITIKDFTNNQIFVLNKTNLVQLIWDGNNWQIILSQ